LENAPVAACDEIVGQGQVWIGEGLI
jgi:hypothetical protein